VKAPSLTIHIRLEFLPELHVSHASTEALHIGCGTIDTVILDAILNIDTFIVPGHRALM
jgi:hypothetical protein